MPPYVIFQVQGKESHSGSSVVVVQVLLGACGEQSCKLFTSFLYIAVNIAAVPVFLYLIAVSSKLFLSQPVNFTFYTSNSLLQPPTLQKRSRQ